MLKWKETDDLIRLQELQTIFKLYKHAPVGSVSITLTRSASVIFIRDALQPSFECPETNNSAAVKLRRSEK